MGSVSVKGISKAFQFILEARIKDGESDADVGSIWKQSKSFNHMILKFHKINRSLRNCKAILLSLQSRLDN